MARRTRNSHRNEQAPGWVWMLFGLGLGLIVAVGVYLRGAAPAASPQTTARPAPASTAPATRARAAPSAPVQETQNRFDFYEILPQFQVVVPEVETRTGPEVRSRPIEEPGRYVLQAGSFNAERDADRQQANLALLGIESRVQRVTIDDDVFHRVRVGPITDLDALNRTRRQLRDAGIETLLMKASE